MREQLRGARAAAAARGGAADGGAGTAGRRRGPDGRHDRLPLPDRRRVARAGARRDRSRGCRPGSRSPPTAIAVDLRRRQGGYGRGARQAIEQDRAEILAGVRHGATIGSPVLLLVRNRDWENWTRVMQVEPLTDDEAAELAALADGGQPAGRSRSPGSGPGHADLAGALKYGFDDVRPILERASARETAARVAAGAVCRAFLAELGIEVWSFTAEVGGVAVDRDRLHADRARRPRRARSAARTRTRRRAMIARIDEARVRSATRSAASSRSSPAGVPIGLGQPRPLGPPARRRARRGDHEHPERQGRGAGARLRADPPARLGGPRRHRGPRRRTAAGSTARTTPAGLTGGITNGAAARGPRRGEADLHARPAAALGRPA